MKIYSSHGINDFIICCGYKGYVIKEYFSNYFLHGSDVTFDMVSNQMHVHQKYGEPWKVTLIDTGDHTMTGGRLKRVKDYLDDGEDFCFTYGDGVSNINITESIRFHRSQKALATVTAVQPPGRFGSLAMARFRVTGFTEKPAGEGGWINGGYFVLSPKVIQLIRDDTTVWECEPLESLAEQGQLAPFMHRGFWQPMDTLRDKMQLEALWESGKAPWKTWK